MSLFHSGLKENSQLGEIVQVVQELHEAVLKDSGMTGLIKIIKIWQSHDTIVY